MKRGAPADAGEILLRRAADGIWLCEHLGGLDGNPVFWHACAMGLEGILAKRRDRTYRLGRCADWIKGEEPGAPG